MLRPVGADGGPLSCLVSVLRIRELAEVIECPKDDLRRLLYSRRTSGEFSSSDSNNVII